MAHGWGDGPCFLAFSLWFPLPVAVLLALCARLFLTGALHEDGLADFSTVLAEDVTGKGFFVS